MSQNDITARKTAKYAKYNASEKGKERQKRHDLTDKGKERYKKRDWTDKGNNSMI